MFDSLTSSADWLFAIFYIIALIIFFLAGPHKVYEWIFGSIIALGCYMFIHEMTFVSPELTRGLFLGNWIVENRWTLLWISKVLIVGLFFITPMTLGLNVAWVVRDTLWFFIKVIFLSAFFLSFGIVLFSILFSTQWALWAVTIFWGFSPDIPYIKNSIVYSWLTERSSIILLAWFALGFYKILFSHWISRIVLFWGIVYVKGNQIFGKKTFDAIPDGWVGDNDDHGGHDSHDSHGDDHHGHH
jgi:hypothetical protein